MTRNLIFGSASASHAVSVCATHFLNRTIQDYYTWLRKHQATMASVDIVLLHVERYC